MCRRKKIMSKSEIEGIESILFRLASDLDGDIVKYNGIKYYVHVMDGTIKTIEEDEEE
jgi:hypothetical protein